MHAVVAVVEKPVRLKNVERNEKNIIGGGGQVNLSCPDLRSQGSSHLNSTNRNRHACKVRRVFLQVREYLFTSAAFTVMREHLKTLTTREEKVCKAGYIFITEAILI